MVWLRDCLRVCVEEVETKRMMVKAQKKDTSRTAFASTSAFDFRHLPRATRAEPILRQSTCVLEVVIPSEHYKILKQAFHHLTTQKDTQQESKWRATSLKA